VWEAKDYEDGQWKSSEVSELRPERAMCWADAVSLTLQRYRSSEQTELHFGHLDGSTFSVEASNRMEASLSGKATGLDARVAPSGRRWRLRTCRERP
jgi:hypothetical protein